MPRCWVSPVRGSRSSSTPATRTSSWGRRQRARQPVIGSSSTASRRPPRTARTSTRRGVGSSTPSGRTSSSARQAGSTTAGSRSNSSTPGSRRIASRSAEGNRTRRWASTSTSGGDMAMTTDASTIVLVHSADAADIGDVIRTLADRGFVAVGTPTRGASDVRAAVEGGTTNGRANDLDAAAFSPRLADRRRERVPVDAAADPLAGGDALAVQYGHWGRAVLLNGLGRYDEALVAARLATDGTPELFLSAWVLPE